MEGIGNSRRDGTKGEHTHKKAKDTDHYGCQETLHSLSEHHFE